MQSKELYQVYVDGSSIGNPGPSGIGVVLKDEQGRTCSEQFDYIGLATNNVAEYRALILALIESFRHGVRRLEVLADSELLVKQMNGKYKVKDGTLKQFHGIIQSFSHHFSELKIRHIPRELNKDADRLAQHASRNKSSSIKSTPNI